MEKTIKMVGLLCAASLIGCTGLFESKTCGIKNSQWERMSIDDQINYQKLFNEKQRLAEQMKLNKMSAKQQKKLAKERRNNEKAQARRLNEERDEIKKQQSNIEAALDLKERTYVNPMLTPDNGFSGEVSPEP